jgi:hypothetical protein
MKLFEKLNYFYKTYDLFKMFAEVRMQEATCSWVGNYNNYFFLQNANFRSTHDQNMMEIGQRSTIRVPYIIKKW